MQFQLTFKSGPKTIAIIKGRDEGIDAAHLTVEEVTGKVIETEQFLEKLTGLRCHIEQVS